MEPIKLPRMTDSEINELVDNQNICQIALNAEEYPYMAPFRYVKIGETLYFHFTDYGKKMKLVQQNNRASVHIEQYTPDLSSYKFVSFRGELKPVEDTDEYNRVVKKFSETGKRSLSRNFLAAHGIDPEKGWNAYTDSGPLKIMKLVNVAEKIGLKNP